MPLQDLANAHYANCQAFIESTYPVIQVLLNDPVQINAITDASLDAIAAAKSNFRSTGRQCWQTILDAGASPNYDPDYFNGLRDYFFEQLDMLDGTLNLLRTRPVDVQVQDNCLGNLTEDDARANFFRDPLNFELPPIIGGPVAV